MIKKFEAVFSRKITFYTILFVSMLVKYFPFGFTYFATTDDNNIYGVYHMFTENRWHDLFIKLNLYALRPLAGIMDIYVLAPLWDIMQLVLLAMIVLHFFTIYLLDGIFEKSGIAWGKFACICFALYPLLSEASYWISASSRIVTGTFLAVLSVFFLLNYIYGNNNRAKRIVSLTVAYISGFLAQGFYEQVVLFSFVFTLVILILHYKAIQKKIIFGVPFVNLVAIGIYYFIFRHVGAMSVRAKGADAGFVKQISIALARVYGVFFLEQPPTVQRTIEWGMRKLLIENKILMLIVLGLTGLLVLCLYFDKTEGEKVRKPVWVSGLTGLLLFASPLGIFFLLSDSSIYLRNIFLPVIGIGIILGLLWQQLSVKGKWCGWLRIGKCFVAFGLILICFASNILEVDGYRIVERYDTIIVENMAIEIERIGRAHDRVWLFNVRYRYEPIIAPHFKHAAITDWAITGDYEVVTHQTTENNIERFYITPVLAGQKYNMNINLETDLLLGLDYEMNVRELVFDNGFLLFKDSGEKLGTLVMGEGGEFSDAAE